ncbi:PID-CTERM protein-sorting domain-containing protein [Lacinutrix sp. Hel_I_90]|uniref:PID-CTERM protein-sorting domain-containing protein n=1 Tax=Lacinutrix sp. Hel_I_90 TaxID=1249999 RepID=UPI00350FD656
MLFFIHLRLIMIKYKKTFASVLLILISFVCSSQSPPEPLQQRPPSPPQLVPIDDGVYLLLVAGFLYGIYKMYQLKRKSI